MKPLHGRAKVFLAVLYLVTLLLLYIYFVNNSISIGFASYIDLFFFSIIMAITESLTVAFRRVSFSTSFAVLIASFLLFGTYCTLLVALIGFTFRIIKYQGNYKHIFNTVFYGTLSNYCLFIISILSSSYFYFLAGGIYPIANIFSSVFPLAVFSVVFYIVNTLLISLLFSVVYRKNAIYTFVGNLRLMVLNILAMAPFGFILAFVYRQYKISGALMLIIPILLARYTFSLYLDARNQYLETIDVLMDAMEARDKYTQGHSQRVAHISESIARELKYKEWKIENLTMAALLHDVGKIGIDDSILNKPGKLTSEEYNIIKKHPVIGYNILKKLKNIDSIMPIVKYHHERYDGKGYPEGKSYTELSLDVFIVQLADSVDAMSTDRPYRKALTEEQIIEELKNNIGTQFHPTVVNAYLRILEKQKKVD